MTKTVITAVTVVFVAAAAHAQGFATGDGGVTRDWYKSNMKVLQAGTASSADTTLAAYPVSAKQAKHERRVVNTIAKKVESERVRHARRQHFNHLPATGAMRDWAVEGRLAEQYGQPVAAAAVRQNTAAPKKQATQKTRQNHVYAEGSTWLAKVTGVARYRGETTEQWNARLLAQTLK